MLGLLVVHMRANNTYLTPCRPFSLQRVSHKNDSGVQYISSDSKRGFSQRGDLHVYGKGAVPGILRASIAVMFASFVKAWQCLNLLCLARCLGGSNTSVRKPDIVKSKCTVFDTLPDLGQRLGASSTLILDGGAQYHQSGLQLQAV